MTGPGSGTPRVEDVDERHARPRTVRPQREGLLQVGDRAVVDDARRLLGDEARRHGGLAGGQESGQGDDDEQADGLHTHERPPGGPLLHPPSVQEPGRHQGDEPDEARERDLGEQDAAVRRQQDGVDRDDDVAREVDARDGDDDDRDRRRHAEAPEDRADVPTRQPQPGRPHTEEGQRGHRAGPEEGGEEVRRGGDDPRRTAAQTEVADADREQAGSGEAMRWPRA